MALDDVRDVLARIDVGGSSACVDDRDRRSVSPEVDVVVSDDRQVAGDQNARQARDRLEDFWVARAVPEDSDDEGGVVAAALLVRRKLGRQLLVEDRLEAQAASALTARS